MRTAAKLLSQTPGEHRYCGILRTPHASHRENVRVDVHGDRLPPRRCVESALIRENAIMGSSA